MLRNALLLLADGGFAFLVSLRFRRADYPSFREWWQNEGLSVWIILAVLISLAVFGVFGYGEP